MINFGSKEFSQLHCLEQELEYLTIHSQNFQRIQRKNVFDYLHTRIKNLKILQKEMEKAKVILKDTQVEKKEEPKKVAKREQKNTG